MKTFAVLAASLLSLVAAQNHSGDAVFFTPGLGSCGFTNTSSQLVASVSTAVYNNFPGATANPNKNPICHRFLNATFNGNSVRAQIVDTCVGCGNNSFGLSPTAFQKLASLDEGRLHHVKWTILPAGQ